MAVISTNQLLQTLDRSHLLDGEQMERLRERLANAPRDLDARRVARSLVDSGQLTLWQARQLLAGRPTFFLGRYKLLDRIGKGGMGVVFKAEHAVMERVVALKIMARALLDNPRAKARFTREVKTAAVLHHPNIITAYDADCVGSTHFLVMEYVDGWDLSQWLQAVGPLPVSLACECAMQTAEGLAHAHHQGMVHRDIKPVNLLVAWDAQTQRPVVKILDMGLARFISETQEDGGVTRAGHVIGTPDYIAPEAAASFRSADIRADVFSLGCALFKLITGRLPFGGENTMEKLLSRTQQDAPAVSSLRPEVPPGLDAVVAKMLARDPVQRYQTPSEVARALSAFAASTLGDQEALSLLHERPDKSPAREQDSLEPDADTSLAEFFLDFTATPAREEPRPPGIAPRRPPSDDEELGFAPIDDEPMPVVTEAGRKPAAAAAVSEKAATPAAPGKQAKTAKPAAKPKTAAQPAPEVEQPTIPDENVSTWSDLLDEPLAGERPDLVVRSRRWWSWRTLLRRMSSTGAGGRWDTPLMLVGGGALLILVISAAALVWAIGRQSGGQALALANAEFDNGNFVQAIEKYDAYLTRFPNHSPTGASQARVRRGVAILRQAVESGSNWPLALSTAQEVIGDIRTETEFGEAHAELAALLPRIAEGLTKEAGARSDPNLAAQAEETVKLVRRYVPQRLQPQQQITEIERSLALVHRDLARDAALAGAIETMQQAADRGEIDAAYAARRELLKAYPQLATSAPLDEAMLAVAEALREAVRADRLDRAAISEEAPSPIEQTVYLANTTVHGESPRGGGPVAAWIDGALYALDGSSGEVLWRRFVGHGPPDATQPIVLSDGDWLITDAARGELVRVAAESGDLRWRQPLPDAPVGQPVVAGNTVVVATADGHVIFVDGRSGAARQDVALPQPLRVGPAADGRGRHVYQVAEHSNLYVLSADDGACQQVVYTGHEPGTTGTPPLVVDRYLILAENHRLDDGRLRVFLLDDRGGVAEEIQQVPLAGHLHVPPVVEGRALYVVTDRGAIDRYELAASQDAPLSPVASAPATGKDHVVRFFTVDGEKLWVADNRLSALEVQSSRGRVMPRWLALEGATFLAPIVQMPDAVYTVRRAGDDQEVIVSAVRPADGALLWETRLGLQPAAQSSPLRSGREVLVFANDGMFYAWTLDQLRDRSAGAGPRAIPIGDGTRLADTAPIEIDDRRWALVTAEPSARLLIVDAADDRLESRWLDLPETLVSRPLAWRGRLLVPGITGQVHWIDPASGQPASEPFQPRLETGIDLTWHAALLPDDSQVLLADNHGRLYRVGIEEEPRPHLVALAEADVGGPLTAPPAAVGDWVYLSRGDGEVQCRRLSDLSMAETWTLDGAAIWGPQRIGEHVLLASDANELVSCDALGRLRWKTTLDGGPLAGTPVQRNASLIATTAGGAVLRIGADDGNVQGSVDVGQPLVSGPLVVGSRLLVAGADGCLHMVAIP